MTSCNDAATLFDLAPIAGKPVGDWQTFIAMASDAIATRRVECFYVAFLNRKNMLIRAEIMWTGTIDHCPVYPREVIREALLCDASAIIVAHNHPSGDPAPSDADIDMSRKLRDACDVLGIAFHDSVIVARGGEWSARGAGEL